MAIPVSQLEVWTNQPSSAMASSTYASICTALKSDKSRIKGRDVEIFLQGSYKNDTNIRGDSDIDVVVQLNNSFIHDISRLSATEQYLFNESMSDATYTWATFRADVLATLIAYYGVSNVLPDNKCIKIEKGNGRLAADVIPCLQYRSYRHFFDISHQSYIEGICFWAQKDGRTIINYPNTLVSAESGG